MQWRDQLCRVAGSEHLGGDVLDEQQLEPIEQLRSRGLFLQSRDLANVKKGGQRLVHEFVLQIGKMHVDDALHRLLIGKPDVVEKAAAEKGVRQFLLVIGSDDDDRAVPGVDRAPRLVDVELHPIELQQQIVGELDVGLVDLVDQQDRRF